MYTKRKMCSAAVARGDAMQYCTNELFLQENRAPEVCWLPSRLTKDLELSAQLILKLDQEKGISENSLVARPSAEATEKTEQNGITDPKSEPNTDEADTKVEPKPAENESVVKEEDSEVKEANGDKQPAILAKAQSGTISLLKIYCYRLL